MKFRKETAEKTGKAQFSPGYGHGAAGAPEFLHRFCRPADTGHCNSGTPDHAEKL